MIKKIFLKIVFVSVFIAGCFCIFGNYQVAHATTVTFTNVSPTLGTSGSWQVPTGVYSITVLVVGGGGGGGDANFGANYTGAGGGGGGSAYAVISTTPGTTYTYQAGGAGSDSTNGTISYFDLNGSHLLTGNGGLGGIGKTASTYVSGGCWVSNCQSYFGGTGAPGNTGGYPRGGGGGGAGGATSGGSGGHSGDTTSGDPVNGGSTNGVGGVGGAGNPGTYTGDGGTGSNGYSYGGGGSGGGIWLGNATTGNYGANGIVQITYTADTTAPTLDNNVTPATLYYTNASPVVISDVGTCTDNIAMDATTPYRASYLDAGTDSSTASGCSDKTGYTVATAWGTSHAISFTATDGHYYCIKLDCKDAAGNTASYYSAGDVLLDTDNPTFSVTNPPVNGSSYKTPDWTSLAPKFSCSDSGSLCNTDSYRYSYTTSVYNSMTTPLDYSAAIPAPSTGTGLTLYVAAKDFAGNIGTNSYGTFNYTATTAITNIDSITGSTVVGQTLTAGALTPSGATATYQWVESSDPSGTYTSISGATSSTYTVQSSDIGKYIEVIATGTGTYAGSVTSDYVGSVIGGILTPSLTSDNYSAGATATYTLSYTIATAAPDMILYTFPYTGFSKVTASNVTVAVNGVTVATAGNTTFGSSWMIYLATPSNAHAGDTITITIPNVTNPSTAGTYKFRNFFETSTTNGVPLDKASSLPGIKITASTPITAIGSITGTAQVNNTLTAGSITPGAATVKYQWTESSSWLGPYSNISGATGSTYTIQSSDIGKYIEVVATGTGSYSGSATSSSSAQVPSTDATLSAVTLSSGTLSPTFASGTLAYTVSVVNATSSLTIIPTASCGHNSTIKVAGTVVSSGAASGAITLAVGSNPINIVVTAPDGVNTKTYTITVTRQASTDATLSGLTLSSGTLSPTFASGTTFYIASVNNSVSSVMVTPTATQTTNATIQVNTTNVASGSASGAMTLAVGSNTINIAVTAPNGSATKSYTIIVSRAVSTDATLSGLTVGSGSLNETFSPTTTAYTETVANNISTITITPTATQANATIKVNTTGVASGSASGAITLAVGSNLINVVVTAPDNSTTKTYTITVTRQQSADDTLSGLTVGSVALTPSFSSGTTSYTAGVDSAVTSVTVTPTANQTNATIKIGDTGVASGAGYNETLAVGNNTVNILVTAPDGTTKQTYAVTIKRDNYPDSKLSNLVASQGTIQPSEGTGIFSPDTYSYIDNVPNETASLTVTPTKSDPSATISVSAKFNGTNLTSKTVASGSQSDPITLNVGSNTITIVVTNSTATDTYTIVVDRKISTDDTLSALTLSSGTLSPVFDPGTLTGYTASVNNSVNSITITPTATQTTNATIKIGGTSVASGAGYSQSLVVGSNTINIVVTAPDNSTTQTYVITVTRQTSTDATLSALTLSSGTLSPVFDPGTLTGYTASVNNSVNSIIITPTATQTTNATIKIGGTSVASGSGYSQSLVVGDNAINIVVTAPDGTTSKTYIVTVTRQASTDATLSALTIDSGTLSPTFASGTASYTASVANNISSVTITPTATQTNATLKISDTGVASSVGYSQSLVVGANTINVVVTAPDNSTTKTYTITITRAAGVGAPTVSNTQTTTTSSTGANVDWSTDKSSSTKVNYGVTTDVPLTTTETDTSTRVTNHAAAISGLVACARYYYQVQGTDGNSITGYGPVNTFTTSGCTGGAAITGTGQGTATTASGGSVSEGNISVTALAGFTSAASSLTIQANQLDNTSFSATAGAPSSHTQVGTDVYNLKAFVDPSTIVSSFDNAITVTMNYTSDEISGLTESSLWIYRYDGSKWYALDSCVVDTVAKTVTCTTQNFSDFAIFGQNQSVALTTCDTGYVLSNGQCVAAGGGGGGLPPEAYLLPSSPSGGFKILINNGASSTNSQNVTLTFNAGTNVKRMAISNTADFYGSGQENYTSTKQWTLLPGNGTKIVYVMFYTSWGQKSQAVSSSIVLKNSSTQTTQTNTNFYKTLKSGSSGDQITLLQDFLRKLGFFPQNTKSNGYFGPATLKAVQAFQVKYNIAKKGDAGYGQVGPNTRKELNILIAQ